MPKVYTENAENQIIPWDPTFRNLDPNYPLFPRTYFSGGAGLSASTFDYAIFLQMLVNGGMYNGKQILGRRTIELMTSPQIAIGNDHFGLGFRITSKKSADQNMFSEGTYSWGGYYGTSYYVDPKEKLITLIMTQHTPNSHGEFNQKVENIIYSSLKK
jgi:CubicO group peptidase (beta-lactamase class C family)